MPRQDRSPLAEQTASMLVGDGDLASVLSVEPGMTFPPVFATSKMIGLMEVAAAKCLRPLLEDDEESVGVTVEATHTAATLPGVTVSATARFLGMDGKKYRFEVVASDPAGEIGRARHDRAIIKAARLMDGARRRRGGGG